MEYSCENPWRQIYLSDSKFATVIGSSREEFFQIAIVESKAWVIFNDLITTQQNTKKGCRSAIEHQ